MGRTTETKRTGIFEALEHEHRTVESLFEQIEALTEADTEECHDLFMVLQEKLLTHADAEEEVVYDRFEELSDELASHIRESREEHALVEKLMAEIEELDGDDPTFKAKMKVLKDLVQRHVEEEEGEIFDLAKEELDAEESAELAEAFMRMRNELAGESPEEEKVESTDLGPQPRPEEIEARH